MSAPVPPAKDPRFRPFRGVTYAVYLLAVTFFCWLVLMSVLRSIDAMSPEKLPERSPPLTVTECVDGAGALYQELENARREMGGGEAATKAASRWGDFRVAWLTQMRELEASCATGSKGRPGLAPVFRQLKKLVEVHTTHAVQYSGEVGPAVVKLHRLMAEARRDAGGR